jgi:DNA invertase Pin-like site-specific DNA recombinase
MLDLSIGRQAAFPVMNEFLIGYARVSTNEQDLTAQHNALEALGVRSNLIYTDHGLTGTNRARPGLREALAACRNGDTLVVTKLDRLARSLRDAKDIVDELTVKGVKLSIGRSVHDPTDPVGRLLVNVLAMVAEFESDLIRARTREGMHVAKATGHPGNNPSYQQPNNVTSWTCTTRARITRARSLSYSTSPAPPCTAPFNDNPSTAEARTRRLPLPSQATQQRDSRTQRPAAVIPMVEPCRRVTISGSPFTVHPKTVLSAHLDFEG